MTSCSPPESSRSAWAPRSSGYRSSGWRIGSVVAAFFVAVFPGNISQLLKHADAFGLDTDRKRVARLFFQPLLVLWALFAGGVI